MDIYTYMMISVTRAEARSQNNKLACKAIACTRAKKMADRFARVSPWGVPRATLEEVRVGGGGGSGGGRGRVGGEKKKHRSRKCGLEITHFPVESRFRGVCSDFLQIPKASNRENIAFHHKPFQIGNLVRICVEKQKKRVNQSKNIENALKKHNQNSHYTCKLGGSLFEAIKLSQFWGKQKRKRKKKAKMNRQSE